MAHWSDGLERVKHPDGRVLIGGSFRGIPFFVESHNKSGGRRNVQHDFAQNDIPAYDDLGRKNGPFQIEAYVLGVDYLVQRDALMSALEDVAGPGELIHPYLGPKRARVGDVSLRESTREGGIATFQIQFLPAPLSVAPTITRDLDSFVASVAAAAFVESQVQFESDYDVEAQPSFATESLSDELVALSEATEAAMLPIVSDIQELAKLNISIDLIIANAAALVREPGDIIDTFIDVVLQLTETILEAPKNMVTALMDAYDLEPVGDVLGDTTTRAQERANQLALSDALRRALVIQSAVMIPAAEFETIDEATDLRDRIVDALDALAATAGDTVYPLVVDLRAAVSQAVPGDRILASEQTIHRNVDLPSLVLSYQLYGDVSQEQAIVDRNGVQHPAFISGDIKVLTFV